MNDRLKAWCHYVLKDSSATEDDRLMVSDIMALQTRIAELERKIITAIPFEKITKQQAERIVALENAMKNIVHETRCVNWDKPEECNCYLGEVLDTLEARSGE